MSIKVKVYNQQAEQVGEEKLSEKIFGLEANEALVHQAMVAQMSNERQVLAHTKDRSEVSGGGRKPWRQKGTGRARVGSNRSPIWIGGGVTFGPLKTRNFKKDINKKMKRKALLMVLSDKVNSDNFVVLEKVEAKEYKTKIINELLNNLESKVLKNEKKDNDKKKLEKRSILIINSENDDKVKYSGRNLAGVKVINLGNINILDLLTFKKLILTRDCIKKIEEQYK